MKTPKAIRPRLPSPCSVKVIGLGGVGSIAARYAAVFLASQHKRARLVLVDGDGFEPGNATRMLFGRYGNKAQVVRSELLPRFRQSRLSLECVPEYVTPHSIRRIIRERDIVLLCVDNHATRKLVNDHCRRLRNICLLSGGNDGAGRDTAGRLRRGTYGNVQVYVRRNGRDRGPHLAAYHPEIAQPADRLPNELNCLALILSTPQILFANLAVASALLNALLLHLSGALRYAELSFDIAEGLMRPTLEMKK